MTHTPERMEPAETQEQAVWEPRVSARGHLSLVDWNEPQGVRPAEIRTIDGRTAEIRFSSGKAVLPQVRRPDPLGRSRAEKLIERGMALWMLSVVLAVCACMAHL